MKRTVTQWLPILGMLVCAALVFLQARTIRQLRNENASLRTPSETAISSEPDQAQKLPAADSREVARLRNEVKQLREQVRRDAPPIFSELVPSLTSFESKAHELAYAASQGDLTAIDKLGEVAMAANERMRKDWNMSDTQALREAFRYLGGKAGTNEPALQAVFRAVRTKYLEGYAIDALGFAAAAGNERALEPLLDPERYVLTQPSTVSALKPAADAGNPRAIEALANVASQENSRALWFMAANGLEAAAANGSARAIDSLARLVMTDEKNARRAAFVALERAAMKQPYAVQALRNLEGK